MTRRRWFLLGGAVVVAWLLVCALLLLRAAGDLKDGRDAAEAARDGLDAEALAAGTPLPDLRQARDRFRAAERGVGNPLLAPMRLVPVVGRQLQSVRALSGAAAEVSDAAVEAVVRLQEVLDAADGGGPARVVQVRALRDAVVRASERVSAVDDLGPRVGLLGPLAEARNELAEQLGEARTTLADAAAGSEAGLRLLEGPGRYLLVAANNAEMRAGSGMWLTGGVLTTAAGRLSLGEISPLYDQADPPDGVVPITDADLDARWGAVFHPSDDWRALMTSPRTAAAAELGARMWEAAGQAPIDGVLVVDPVALAAVVRATGPVQVGDRTITADQVVPLLLHEQYLAFGDDDDEKAARQESLGVIASAAFQALDAGDWRPETLAAELADAVAGRHLLAWSADPAEQRGWAAAGLAGELGEDTLLVSMLNGGANKLDWFLETEGDIEVEPGRRATEVTVRLRFRNTTPGDLPRYVAGPPFGRDWEAGRYVGVLSVNVPGAATDVRFEGLQPLVAGADGPTQVVAAEVQLAPGEEREVVLRFRLPGRSGRLRVAPSARVPGVTWHYGTRTWQDSQGRTANW